MSIKTSLHLRYLLFALSVLFTTIAIQAIIQYDLAQQESDAHLINAAGRQRMTGQRIAKLILFLHYNTLQTQPFEHYLLDTLQKLKHRLQSNHEMLAASRYNQGGSSRIDSLLAANEKFVARTSQLSDAVYANPSAEVLVSAIGQLAELELPFLFHAEALTSAFQNEAELKLLRFRRIELLLSVLAILLVAGEFVFLILPTFRQLQKKNTLLQEANSALDRAHEKTVQERLLLRTIIDNIPINIYVKDHLSRKVLANRAEYLHMGVSSEEELLGKDDVQLYPFASAQLSLAEDQRVLQGETMINAETENIRFDGKHTWFLISKIPLREANGTITGLVGISLDITDRKAIEAQLAQREKLYRLISENSQDVISINSLTGVFEYISPSCVSLHGYTPEELIGRNGLDFIHPDDARVIASQTGVILDKMKRGEPLEPMQFRLASKHRGYVWVENVFRPIEANGEITGFQATVRDISQRKAHEEELEEAKHRAEEATHAKSKFLSLMSHEIRTPLNGIVGLTHLLLAANPLPHQAEKLKLLKFSCDNLLTIINDILDFNKGEAGKIELEHIVFNLPECLQHYRQLFAERAEERKIRLEFELDQRLPTHVYGDPVRLGQVISNLIGNAIKFTERGEVVLRATVVEKRAELHRIHFHIRDTGIGIPDDKIASVFEGFLQASADITRKYGGTGLGLSIARQLLRLMGSEISMKSKPGVGTEFSFELELTAASANITQTHSTVRPDLAGLHVLLVEDNPVNQLVASNFLRNWGIEVTVAEDGEKALVAMATTRFNLVLMDLHMPIMNGYETTRAIRSKKDPLLTQLHIIALTADVSPEIRKACSEAGMTDVLAKPFQPNDLLMMINKYAAPASFTQPIVHPVHAKLRTYAEGNADVAAELKRLLNKTLEELQLFLDQLAQRQTADLEALLHKSKTAIFILSEQKLSEGLDQLKTHFDRLARHHIPVPESFIRDLMLVINTLRAELAT